MKANNFKYPRKHKAQNYKMQLDKISYPDE